jgi:hypothetical protein
MEAGLRSEVTKSTFKRTTCGSCNESYPTKRQHVCDFAKLDAKKGTVHSTPQKTRSNKMAFGKGGP